MTKKYRTILADPPWPMRLMGSYLVGKHVKPAKLCYPTMTIEEIKAMPVGNLAEDGAHLWLWTVNQLLREAFDVMDAWGFTYLAPITWRKPSGNGNYFIHLTQHLLFGYKKKCVFNQARYIPNAYDWEAQEGKPTDLEYRWPFPRVHSRKPAGSYQLIESVSDEPRLELFARPITQMFPKIEGWDSIGDAIDGKDIIESLHEIASI